MRKTQKMKKLELTVSTVGELTKVSGGAPVVAVETGVRTCGTPCNPTMTCPRE